MGRTTYVPKSDLLIAINGPDRFLNIIFGKGHNNKNESVIH